MAVDRQLRDEMDRLIVGAIRKEIPDGYERLVNLMETRERDADATRDEGAQFVALGVLTGNWRVWTGYDWNEDIYQKHRRLITFLRSDVDYAERETKRARIINKWRLSIDIISTIIAVYIVVIFARQVGNHGLWLWFATSIPMLISAWLWRRKQKAITDRLYAPFHSAEQFRQYEYLADRPPTLPPLSVLNPPLRGWPLVRRALRRLWDGGSTYVLMGLLFLFIAATWPLFLYENWVCEIVCEQEHVRQAK